MLFTHGMCKISSIARRREAKEAENRAHREAVREAELLQESFARNRERAVSSSRRNPTPQQDEDESEVWIEPPQEKKKERRMSLGDSVRQNFNQ